VLACADAVPSATAQKSQATIDPFDRSFTSRKCKVYILPGVRRIQRFPILTDMTVLRGAL